MTVKVNKFIRSVLLNGGLFLASCLLVLQSSPQFVFSVSLGSSAFAAVVTQAESKTRPLQGFESYLSRPDILNLEPGGNQVVDPKWEPMLKAHFSFVALLLELYPEEELYFLGRDGEYLYDAARLATASPKVDGQKK